MPLNFTKDKKIIVVHGVQLGSDVDIDGPQKIRQLVDQSLQQSGIHATFDVEGYFYEDINDHAQKFYKYLGEAILSSQPLAGLVFEKALDLVGDVVTAAASTSTAMTIINDLKSQILQAYQQQTPVYLVSHSLGTVYALQVINMLMSQKTYYQKDDQTDWPIIGLLTMGSPLGLSLNFSAYDIFPYYQPTKLSQLHQQRFNWQNYFNRLDPIVSGEIFGKPVAISGSSGPVEERYSIECQQANWQLTGNLITQGSQWLFAHTSYWESPVIGDQIVNQLWG